ncbi:MAG: mandelate racemase/muconate lactonizing enzyme family protein, partial [Cyclobacteriaceae bacterium]|nr:mandelate racemase/muconate lactonizing enzyme family protein [Cyclobacteriaceae bacterium]
MIYKNKKLRDIFKNTLKEEKEKQTKSRRSFFKKAGLGGLSLAGLTMASVGEQVAYASQNVNRSSNPSDLKITDMRIAEIGGDVVFRTPIVR